MSYWRPEHQALLEAMRADETVPELIRRLTGPLFDFSRDDALRWRAWGLSLHESEGGRHVLDRLGRPEDWPQAWEDAEELGFSPRGDHHNALLFIELFRRAAEDDLEIARHCWRYALRAWSRLERSDYLEDLGQRLVAETDVDFAPIVSQLLAPHVEYLLDQLKRALQLQADTFVPARIDRARWAWLCLDDAAAMVGVPSRYGVLETLRQRAIEAKAFIVASASSRFRRGLDAIDWSSGDRDAIVTPLVWLADVSEVVEFRESLSTLALKQTIDGAWSLRKLERDGEEIFVELLEAAGPFADDVAERVAAGQALGHGTRVADYLVFLAEPTVDVKQKTAYLERAMEFSPEHRNARMMLSYVMIAEVAVTLQDLSLIPRFVSKSAIVGDPVVDKIYSAWALCNQVEELYPWNRELESYRDRVREQARRFGATLPGDAQEDHGE